MNEMRWITMNEIVVGLNGMNSFIFFIITMDYIELRKNMLAQAKEQEDDIVQRWDWEDLWNIMSEFVNDFKLNYDVDYVESSTDSWIQQTVRIPNMILGWKWYTVILDNDFWCEFDTIEEFVDHLIEAEKIAINVLSYFKK